MRQDPSNRISIIIPTYNRAEVLQDNIDSIFEQTVNTKANIEFVIGDDCSTDDTEGKVIRPLIEKINSTIEMSKHYRIIYFKEETNSGPYPIRNKALGLCTGKYITFLDSDDTYHDADSLLNLYDMINTADSKFVYGDATLYENKKGEWEETREFKFSPYNYATLFGSRGLIPMGSFLFNREVWETIGGFDCGMKFGADFEWQLRVGAKFTFIHIDKYILSYYRRDDGIQKSGKKLNDIKSVYRIINQTHEDIKNEVNGILKKRSSSLDDFQKNLRILVAYPAKVFQPIVDVATTIYRSFSSYGINVELRAIESSHSLLHIADTEAYNYILSINTHCYIEHEEKPLLCHSGRTKILIYNLEQTPIDDQNSHWASHRLGQVAQLLPNADYVVNEHWSKNKAVRELGATTLVLPMMYHPSYEAPEFLTRDGKKYDVAYFGAGSTRRNDLVTKLQKKGVTFAPALAPQSWHRGYKDRIISKSRISLNIHFSKMEYFEGPRLMYDFFINKAVVLSEKILYPGPFKNTEHLFMAKYQNLEMLIKVLLEKDDKLLQETGDRAYDLFKDEYYYTHVIHNFLMDLYNAERKHYVGREV